MSSPESKDEYSAWDYKIEQYNRGVGPPLITKKARLILTTVQNDIETLKKLLDAPKWYEVRDMDGYNLLQIAIFMASYHVFDYLLSFDLLLEAVDAAGSTALVISLNPVFVKILGIDECFALELIKQGADINKTSPQGDTLLQCALECGFASVAGLLLEKGATLNSPNSPGITPLHVCLNPSYQTYDVCLLQLAIETKSSFFKQIIKFISDKIMSTSHFSACIRLFQTDPENLRILLNKCPNFIKEMLKGFKAGDTCACLDLNLKIFDVLFNSSVRPEVLQFISKLKFFPLPLSLEKSNTCEILEIFFYLLSHGMPLHEIDLQEIYKMTGYSKDFKKLLIMDVQTGDGDQITEMMPRLIYDVTLNLHKAVIDQSFCDLIDWKQLFQYFAHPKIQQAYYYFEYDIQDDQIIDRELPRIPLLQELARDAFRKYFVEAFEITTAKQFYSLINLLPVSFVHKKIITFESKLY